MLGQATRRVSWIVGVVVAVILLAAAPAAAGVPIGFGPHSGNYGVHTLIDNGEYAGAACGYNSIGTIQNIGIRGPIVFGFNRTSAVDTQKVGWRYRIQDSDDGNSWSNVSTSNLVKATATDKVNAHFPARTFNFEIVPLTTYFRVTIDLFWFYPDATHVDGRANHVVEWYRIDSQIAQTWCPEQQPKTVVTLPPPGHSGNYGLHSLIDNGEYPGVTCVYNNTKDNDFLRSMVVRAPIVYAVDRTSGVDTQTVGWKYTIQYTSDNTTWHPLVTSTLVKATATDHANARFGSRTYDFGPFPSYSYRVVVHILWFYPTSSVKNGTAAHLVTYYRGGGPGVSFVTTDFCGDTLG